jgi:hypothetical protein
MPGYHGHRISFEERSMNLDPAIANAVNRRPAVARRTCRRAIPDPSPAAVKVQFADVFDPARSHLERFIRESFEAAYGAQLDRLMPTLMSVRGPRGDLIAACGLRDPQRCALFLEAYLDEPVEWVLECATRAPVTRRRLMEVGNLAVARPGFARFLIAALADHLHDSAREWAVFTAVPALRNAFSRLGIELITLAPARIGRIPPRERARWGSYYDQKPLVMAANVEQSRSALGRAGVLPVAP